MGWIGSVLVDVVFAIVAIIAAIWAGGVAKRFIVAKSREYEHIDETLFTFIGNVVQWALMGFAVMFVLAEFGVQTASLVAVIGAAGLAIGLAMQGTLANLAAGVLLVVLRPFKHGDYVEIGGGSSGTVEEITLFFTRLRTPGNLEIIVPNREVFNSTMTNYNTFDTRRVDLVFGVGYGSDLKKAEDILRKLVEADDRITDDPAPFVKVTNLGASSVDFTVRVWVDRPDYWDVKFALTRQAKEAFDKGGIDIPFPTTTIVRAET